MSLFGDNRGHDFSQATGRCRFCGVSRTAAMAAKVFCYPDTTNLVSLMHHMELRRMEKQYDEDHGNHG